MWKLALILFLALGMVTAFFIGVVAIKQHLGLAATMIWLILTLVIAIIARLFLIEKVRETWRRKWREIVGGGLMLTGFIWALLIGTYLIPDKLTIGPVVLLLGGLVLMVSSPRSPSVRRSN